MFQSVFSLILGFPGFIITCLTLKAPLFFASHPSLTKEERMEEMLRYAYWYTWMFWGSLFSGAVLLLFGLVAGWVLFFLFAVVYLVVTALLRIGFEFRKQEARDAVSKDSDIDE